MFEKALGRGALGVAALILSVTVVSAKAADPETDDQKTFYVMGLSLARNLAGLQLSEDDLSHLVQGLEDGALGHEPKVVPDDFGPRIRDLTERRRASVAAVEKKEGDALLATAAAEDGAVKSPSGMVLRILQPGSGPSPAASDTVKVHYHGTLRDGTVFDSSRDRGEPASFPLNRVIPCWTEAVQKLSVGAKAKITCPAEIAYGDRGAPPHIKPGATLVFEVELLEVVKADAAPSPDGAP